MSSTATASRTRLLLYAVAAFAGIALALAGNDSAHASDTLPTPRATVTDLVGDTADVRPAVKPHQVKPHRVPRASAAALKSRPVRTVVDHVNTIGERADQAVKPLPTVGRTVDQATDLVATVGDVTADSTARIRDRAATQRALLGRTLSPGALTIGLPVTGVQTTDRAPATVGGRRPVPAVPAGLTLLLPAGSPTADDSTRPNVTARTAAPRRQPVFPTAEVIPLFPVPGSGSTTTGSGDVTTPPTNPNPTGLAPGQPWTPAAGTTTCTWHPDTAYTGRAQPPSPPPG